jgi:iron complex outermembrane receptor protein
LVFSVFSYADNPGDDLVESQETAVAQVAEEAEEVVESTPVAESDEDADGDDEVVTLEKVTVTGSRIKRSQVEGATPLIVISKQDMKDNGYRNLTEALQSLPIANGFTQNEQLVNTFTPTY